MQFRGLYVTDEIAFWAATGSNLVQSEIFLYRDDPGTIGAGVPKPRQNVGSCMGIVWQPLS